jgi:hypothetical protein
LADVKAFLHRVGSLDWTPRSPKKRHGWGCPQLACSSEEGQVVDDERKLFPEPSVEAEAVGNAQGGGAGSFCGKTAGRAGNSILAGLANVYRFDLD